MTSSFHKLFALAVIGTLTGTMIGCVSPSSWPFSGGKKSQGMPLANSAPMPTPGADASQPSTWNKMVSSVKGAFQSREPSDRGQKSGGSSPFESQFAMARLVERRGEAAQAEKIYRSMLSEHGEHPLLLHRLGVLAAQDSRLGEAEGLLRQAQNLDPENAELLNDLAYAYFLQDRLQESESLLHRVLQIDPRNKRARNNLGLAIGMQGRVNESMAAFRRGVESEAEAFANQAYVLAQLGELDKAEATYSHALTIDSGMRSVGEALVEVSRARQMVRLSELARQSEQGPETLREAAKLRASLAKSGHMPAPPPMPPAAQPSNHSATPPAMLARQSAPQAGQRNVHAIPSPTQTAQARPTTLRPSKGIDQPMTWRPNNPPKSRQHRQVARTITPAPRAPASTSPARPPARHAPAVAEASQPVRARIGSSEKPNWPVKKVGYEIPTRVRLSDHR